MPNLAGAGVPHELRAFAAGHGINAAAQADKAAWLARQLPPG